MYNLPEERIRRQWDDKHGKAFQYLKKLLKNATLFAHREEKNSLSLACDACRHAVHGLLARTDLKDQEDAVALD